MRVLHEYVKAHYSELPLSVRNAFDATGVGLPLDCCTYVSDVISAEGPKALEGYDRPGWAQYFIAKMALVEQTHLFYSPGGRSTVIDRETAAWNEPVKCTLTLPRGLILEASRVISLLDESELRVSLSGLVDGSLRELFWKRPIDDEDEQYFDSDWDASPEGSTVAEVLKEHNITVRRKSVSVP